MIDREEQEVGDAHSSTNTHTHTHTHTVGISVSILTARGEKSIIQTLHYKKINKYLRGKVLKIFIIMGFTA